MEAQVADVVIHYVEHGTGRPLLVLHGAGVDHREAEACFEPAFSGIAGLRRIYPDLPGMGRTIATERVNSGDDVVEILLGFAREVSDGDLLLVVGHSAGGYFAQGMASRAPELFAGLALVCALLPGISGVPGHRVVVDHSDVEGQPEIGDEAFRSYFVIHSPEMLDRYQRFVAPGNALVDHAALERIGAHWELSQGEASAYPGPTLIVAGRLDSTVGYAASADLLERYPRATLAVLDDAGHALPHERPAVLRALFAEWLARVDGSAESTG